MEYRNSPNEQTLSEIQKTLTFIRAHGNNLMEMPGDSKWTDGHTLFRYESDDAGIYTYMIGALKSGKVTWHIMPMYGVTEMKEKWSSALKPFVSGKSCINFKSFSDLPEDAILDIVKNGTQLFKKEMDAYYAKRKKR